MPRSAKTLVYINKLLRAIREEDPHINSPHSNRDPTTKHRRRTHEQAFGNTQDGNKKRKLHSKDTVDSTINKNVAIALVENNKAKQSRRTHEQAFGNTQDGNKKRKLHSKDAVDSIINKDVAIALVENNKAKQSANVQEQCLTEWSSAQSNDETEMPRSVKTFDDYTNKLWRAIREEDPHINSPHSNRDPTTEHRRTEQAFGNTKDGNKKRKLHSKDDLDSIINKNVSMVEIQLSSLQIALVAKQSGKPSRMCRNSV